MYNSLYFTITENLLLSYSDSVRHKCKKCFVDFTHEVPDQKSSILSICHRFMYQL